MFFIIIFNYYPIRETSEFQKPNCRIFVQIHPRSLSFCSTIRPKSYGISHNFNPHSTGYPVTEPPLSYGISRNEKPSVFMGYPITSCTSFCKSLGTPYGISHKFRSNRFSNSNCKQKTAPAWDQSQTGAQICWLYFARICFSKSTYIDILVNLILIKVI